MAIGGSNCMRYKAKENECKKITLEYNGNVIFLQYGNDVLYKVLGEGIC